MSCAYRYKQISKLFQAQTGVPAGVCPLAIAVTPGARQVIERLQSAGHQAVVVGGAVRDAARGLTSHDSDVATSATPGQVQALFGEAVYDAGGKAHGTMLIAAEGEEPIEVTTFRRDVSTDGRNATVAFTDDLLTDLQRRDLTVNALAYDPVAEELYGPDGDPSSSLDDLVKGEISFVGDGIERIREDRLRAIRAPRIEAKLDGKLSLSAEAAIGQAVDEGLLPGPLSAERVRDELLKTLDLPDGVRGLRRWQQLGLMKVFLPEVAACQGQAQNIHHDGIDVLEHNFRAAEAVDVESPGLDVFRDPDKVPVPGDKVPVPGDKVPVPGDKEDHYAAGKMRLTMMLHDVGKPPTADYRGRDYGYSFIGHEKEGARMVDDICRRLKLDNKTRGFIVLAAREHMAVPKPDASEKSIRRWARRVGGENVEFLLTVRAADWGAAGRDKAEETRRGAQRVRRVLAEAKEAQTERLAVNGHAVMKSLGLKRGGPEVGQALRHLEGLVDADPKMNNREALLESLRVWKEDGGRRKS